jgi:pimeloyl-ACP methyl ester carboxylesterase
LVLAGVDAGDVIVDSAQLTAWQEGGEVMRLLGRRIFTRTAIAAERKPLLLIHGYPTSSYDWHALWAPLAERFSLYALDLLGFGLSEKPPDARYTIEQQADFCQALLAEHEVGSVHVLAHDYGDTVAQELLARDLEGRIRVRSVSFLNGGLFPETHRPRPVQRLLALPLIGRLVARATTYCRFESAMRAIAGRKPPSRDELRDQWELLTREDGRAALAGLISYMKQRRLQRKRWVGALTETTVPRQLICGAMDPVSGAHLADRYRELVPNPDVTLLPDVGHYPQLEAPDAVLAEYLRFRAALQPPAPAAWPAGPNTEVPTHKTANHPDHARR